MKHNWKITGIIIAMFLITQLIGIWIVNSYQTQTLPYGMQPPEEIKQVEGTGLLIQIMISFAFAIFLLFILTKIKAEKFLRAWFFIVTILAISLTLNVVLFKMNLIHASIIAVVIALPLAFFKIFKRNILIHNITELMIYPGIAAVFVSILGVLGIILLLLAISLYDIWAVWHSGFMQKMAKYQMNTLKVFGGFFIPYIKRHDRVKIKNIKQKYKGKSEKIMENAFKKAKIKINLAILGGGDIVFPIIASGVFLKVYGVGSALIIALSASLGLLYLLINSEKGKFYPAMPFLTIAMYIGMVISWLLF
ncbi:MAG: presenilin family intramembrane aspartyl protease [Candidatus Pacearchaeota archaeon]